MNIYLCPKCRFTDVMDEGMNGTCLRCNTSYVDLGLSTREWNELDDFQRDNVINQNSFQDIPAAPILSDAPATEDAFASTVNEGNDEVSNAVNGYNNEVSNAVNGYNNMPERIEYDVIPDTVDDAISDNSATIEPDKDSLTNENAVKYDYESEPKVQERADRAGKKVKQIGVTTEEGEPVGTMDTSDVLNEADDSNNVESKKSGSNKIVIILSCVLGVLVVGLLVGFFLFVKPSYDPMIFIKNRIESVKESIGNKKSNKPDELADSNFDTADNEAEEDEEIAPEEIVYDETGEGSTEDYDEEFEEESDESVEDETEDAFEYMKEGKLTEEEYAAATQEQQSVYESVVTYLHYAPYAYEELKNQLIDDGYAEADIEWALEKYGIDWNEQAILSAKDYLESSAFSEKGLIGQLTSDGYTQEQAEYGVANCGADWSEQAKLDALDYLEYEDVFNSVEAMTDQLKADEFTDEQIEYAIEQAGIK